MSFYLYHILVIFFKNLSKLIYNRDCLFNEISLTGCKQNGTIQIQFYILCIEIHIHLSGQL